MHSGRAISSVDGRVPVFIFPSSLTFFADDQATHKQVLTLYNPYDFVLKFKVLSTAPRKYIVVESEGALRSRCCIDIVIRHNAIAPANCGVTDKFRIQMQEQGRHQPIGKKDIPATLLASRPELLPASAFSSSEGEHFEQLPPQAQGQHQQQQYSIGGAAGSGSSSPNLIFILAAVICIVALMLPLEGAKDTGLPSYFHLSLHQKLIFAYTLGLVTMVILRGA